MQNDLPRGVSGHTQIVVGTRPHGVKRTALKWIDREFYERLFDKKPGPVHRRLRPAMRRLRRAALDRSISFSMFIQQLLEWALSARQCTIHDLYNMSCAVPIRQTPGQIFTARGTPPLLIKTPTGFSSAQAILKTYPLRKFTIELADGRHLDCTPAHIVVCELGDREAQELQPHESIFTIDGSAQVTRTHQPQDFIEMYDIELDDDYNVYYTNGVLSRNTTLTDSST